MQIRSRLYGLRRETVINNAYRYDDLELWWLALDGNLSDMSSNGRSATAGGQRDWEEAGLDKPLLLPATIIWRLRIHFTAESLEQQPALFDVDQNNRYDKNWRTLASWGHEVNGAKVVVSSCIANQLHDALLRNRCEQILCEEH